MDPAVFVISANIKRRHLTKMQQVELIDAARQAAKVQNNDLAVVARSFSPTEGRMVDALDAREMWIA